MFSYKVCSRIRQNRKDANPFNITWILKHVWDSTGNYRFISFMSRGHRIYSGMQG